MCMMVVNLSIESLMLPSTDTLTEPCCLFSLGPNPKEDDQNDSDALAKAMCLYLCDEVMEEVVEDRGTEAD